MILYIKQSGCEILHRGRILRTPVKLTIKKSDLSRYKKMLEFKSISLYDIIDDSVAIKKIYNSSSVIKPEKIKQLSSDNKIMEDIDTNNRLKHIVKKENKIRSMNRMPNIVKKEKIVEDTNDYLDSIENDIEIDIDIDSDDILKQLLANI